MKHCVNRVCAALIVVMMLLSCSVIGTGAATTIVDDGFEFSRDTDGITIYKYVGKEQDVAIPSTLLSKSVVAIKEYAFMNNTIIRSMSMPASITTLERGLFYGCTNLSSVVLPKNCTTIGQYMFYNCTSLTSVSLPTLLTEVPRYCFSRCSSLESVTLPSSATVIGEYAFANCANLQSVYVSKYTKSIDPTAFQNSPQVVIYGYMNTYAYDFAMEYSIPFAAIDAPAEVYYVTFYNYDGSVYYSVPATAGSSVKTPIGPEKPETETHYYEFLSWEGNTQNIQQNEFLYPAYIEYVKTPDVPESATMHNVVFLGADDVFLNVQSVADGYGAIAPEITPTKKPTEEYEYTFSGWDTDFECVTKSLIIRATFEEKVREYTVTFTDIDGNTIHEQKLAYGQSATAPEAPEVDGYTFVAWDKAFDFVTKNITVKATYKKTPAPVAPATTGKLRVELAGGTSFTIAVNDGAARPQGASYTNTKMTIGSDVTLVANTTGSAEFIGWMDETGALRSTTDTLTFITTGNDYYKAVYTTEVKGVNLVTFKNTKAVSGKGQILDMQYYAAGNEVVFPDAPTQAGYDFTGWSMTAEQIQAALAAGKDVTVEATWEYAKVYIDLKVNGGKITSGDITDGKGLAYNAYTVTADAAPEGQKFAYWVDANGNVMSYSAEYKFYPAADMELTAIYVAENENVEKKGLVSIAGDPTTTGTKIAYTLSWEIDATLGKVFNYGILFVNENDYKEDTFYHGSGDSKMFDRAVSATSNVDVKSLTLSQNQGIAYDNTFIAKAFVIYTDAATGEAVTVYSDAITVYKAAP